MSDMKRLLATLALTLLTFLGAAQVASAAGPAPAEHWCASVGEFQNVRLDVAPPCTISVYMVPGKVGGRTVEQRCAGRGNETRLTTARFRGKLYRVCHNVDY